MVKNIASIFLFLAPLAAIGATADTSRCDEMIRALPEKIGDLPLVKKECKLITPDIAKAIHATAGARYLEAVYQSKSPLRYVMFNASAGDPALPDAKGNAEIIARERDSTKTAQSAVASGVPDVVKIGKDYLAHTRVVKLAQPDEGKLVWHEGPNPSAEVAGVVNGGVFINIQMSAADLDSASNTLQQINSAIKYAQLQ